MQDSPLHEAASNDHRDVAELLLSYTADSNACARDGTRWVGEMCASLR